MTEYIAFYVLVILIIAKKGLDSDIIDNLIFPLLEEFILAK